MTANSLAEFYLSPAITAQRTYEGFMLKAQGVFKYTDLPATLPHRILEGLLTKNGDGIIFEKDGSIIATAYTTEETDIYGDPHKVRPVFHRGDAPGTVASTSETLTVGVDCILARNDYASRGLEQVAREFSSQMGQGLLTLHRSLVTLRTPYMIRAKDENTYRSAVDLENQLLAGQPAVFISPEFFDLEGSEITLIPAGSTATQAIEVVQYLQSLYYSEIGIDLNNSMKSQYVSEVEISKTSGGPLVDIMLECRKEMCAQVKALFGVEIEVELQSNFLDAAASASEQVELEHGEDPEEPAETEPVERQVEEEPEVEEPTEEPEEPEVTAEELKEASEVLETDEE